MGGVITLSPHSLGEEVGKRRGFESAEQEAFLNIIRTASFLETEFGRLFKKHGLSMATYNVLRILRGSSETKSNGTTCGQIRDMMVTPVPDVTRLVDRLETQGFVSRVRCNEDRRVVYVKITEQGKSLLQEMDGPVAELHRSQLEHMDPDQLRSLSDLLVEARSNGT